MKVKKTESTINPGNFRIGERKGNLIEVVFFDEIEEVTRTSEETSKQVMFCYYEYKLYIIYRDNVEDYIVENLDMYKNLARDKFITEKAAEIRKIRDNLLLDSDKFFLIDRLGISMPEEITAASLLGVVKDLFQFLGNILNGAWSKYRQELRDITKQPNFPFDVTFPKIPTEKEDHE